MCGEGHLSVTVVHACRQCGSKGRTHVMGLEAVLGHNDGVDLEQCVLVSKVDVRVEHRVLVVVVLNALRGGGAWARARGGGGVECRTCVGKPKESPSSQRATRTLTTRTLTTRTHTHTYMAVIGAVVKRSEGLSDPRLWHGHRPSQHVLQRQRWWCGQGAWAGLLGHALPCHSRPHKQRQHGGRSWMPHDPVNPL